MRPKRVRKQESRWTVDNFGDQDHKRQGKMQTSKDPTEIGDNVDVVFPWASAGDGEACGERPPAGATACILYNP